MNIPIESYTNTNLPGTLIAAYMKRNAVLCKRKATYGDYFQRHAKIMELLRQDTQIISENNLDFRSHV